MKGSHSTSMGGAIALAIVVVICVVAGVARASPGAGDVLLTTDPESGDLVLNTTAPNSTLVFNDVRVDSSIRKALGELDTYAMMRTAGDDGAGGELAAARADVESTLREATSNATEKYPHLADLPALGVRTVGTPRYDGAAGMAINRHKTRVFLVGTTGGNLAPTATNEGVDQNMFVAAVHPRTASMSWVVQLEIPSTFGHGVAVDDVRGRVLAVGHGDGLPSAKGGNDVLVLCLDAATGKELWNRTLGTSSRDFAGGIAVLSGGDVVVGVTVGISLPGEAALGEEEIAVFRLRGSDGGDVWARQYGTAGRDQCSVIIAPRDAEDERVYVGGFVSGALPTQEHHGETDLAVLCLNGTSGDVLWSRQLGSDSFDYASDIAVDEEQDAIFVAGAAAGAMDFDDMTFNFLRGGRDAVVVRLDAMTGGVEWGKQFGTGQNDYAMGVAVDEATSRLYVAASTSGQLVPDTPAGYGLVLLQMDEANAQDLAETQIGGGYDVPAAVVLGPGNTVLIGGTARRPIFGWAAEPGVGLDGIPVSENSEGDAFIAAFFAP